MGDFSTYDRGGEGGRHVIGLQGFDEALGRSLGGSARIHFRDYGRNSERWVEKREDGQGGHVDFSFLHSEILLEHADLPIEGFVHVANAFWGTC